MDSYHQGKSTADISAVYVTDYYTLELISAATAFFVAARDVYGRMGRELIAFSSVANAEEFLQDHHGSEMTRFDALSPELLKSLD